MKNLKSKIGLVVITIVTILILITGCNEQMVLPVENTSLNENKNQTGDAITVKFNTVIKLPAGKTITFNELNLPFKKFNYFRIRNLTPHLSATESKSCDWMSIYWQDHWSTNDVEGCLILNQDFQGNPYLGYNMKIWNKKPGRTLILEILINE